MAARTKSIPEPWTFNRGLRWSVIFHFSLAIFIVIKSLIFPSEIKPFIPSLRVDLVGLPDLLKKDLERAKTLPMPKTGEPDDAKPKAPKVKSVEEPTEPDEMILSPKLAKDGKKTKKAEEEKTKDRAKKALARIKALEKIKDASENDTDESSVVKGNQVSKGAALSGNAKESTEQGYYELVLTRLQANWALPTWLSRQNFQAQVQAFIDNKGRVRRLQFIKPSGNAQFDDAVKRAVSASEPFPIPPVELRGSLLSHGVLLGFPL